MFKWYGFLGSILVLFAELNFFLRIQPFANWYFPIIWFGYILLVDAAVYKIKGKSMICGNLKKFVLIVSISALIWVLFEMFNLFIENWVYVGVGGFGSEFTKMLFGLLSFATVLPGVFETAELLGSFKLFHKVKLKESHKITHKFLYIMIGLGFVSLIAPILWPKYTFALVWVNLFFILDPINYLHNQPSIIKHLKDRKLQIPLILLLAGLVCGFLWEFWNFWAIPKWNYTVPFVGFLKIFEMPVLGYIGFAFLAWELYAIYHFIGTLFNKDKTVKKFLLKTY